MEFTVEDILSDCIVKQQWLLHDMTHSLTQGFGAVLLDIDIIDQNLTEVWVIES